MLDFNDTIVAPATATGGALALIRVSGPDALRVLDGVFVGCGAASADDGCDVGALCGKGGSGVAAVDGSGAGPLCNKGGSGVAAADGSGAGPLCDKGSVGAKRRSVCDFAGYTLHFGRIMDGAEVLDEVMVSVFRAPHSYTGEDGAEISCHGSPYIVSRLLELLIARGARLALPGEFTQRAFLAGKMDLAQAEAVADVISSDSAAAHRVAVNHLLGGYSSKLKELRGSLVELSALLELELDFSEEDVEFADRSRLSALCSEAMAECSRLADSFSLGNAVKDGVPVAIVGAPNSGKSTLLNALLCDQRAIVSDIPGTTRDTVEECVVIDGVKFRFIDTAGLRDTSDVIEKMGIERSLAALRKAAIVIEVVDVSGEDAVAAESALGTRYGLPVNCWSGQIAEALSASRKHIVAFNKCDLARIPNRADDAVAVADSAQPPSVKISAKMGTGLDELKRLLCEVSGVAGVTETVLVTNARHAAELRSAASALNCVLSGLAAGLDGALLAEDLRDALSHLGSITGEITSDEVLGEIFGKFCIGK